MNKEARDIFEDLGYSMSQAEADHLSSLILEKDYRKAKKLLLEHLNENDAKTLIQYYKDKSKNRYNLEEIEVDEISLDDYEQSYLIKIGTKIVQSRVYMVRDKPSFYFGQEFVPLERAEQAWIIKQQ